MVLTKSTATEQSEKLKMMFITSEELSDDGALLRGGALVTDENTLPLEFRCTGSIKISSLQKMLVNLIGKPLLNSCKVKPTLVLTDQPFILGARSESNWPFVWIGSDSVDPVMPLSEKHEILKPKKKGGHTIVIRTLDHYESDIVYAANQMAELIEDHDIFEPFERIKKALVVIEQEERNKKR